MKEAPVKRRTIAGLLTASLTIGHARGEKPFDDRSPHGAAAAEVSAPVTPPFEGLRLPTTDAANPGSKPYPINLPTALHLAGVDPLDIALATERLRAASARLERARVLWLPTINVGVDYFRHDGRIQDVRGDLFDTSRSSLMAGVGPSLSFGVTDALYAPLAGRQVVRARQADVQTARNNSLFAVAEAYFNVQQARGEAGGAESAARLAAEQVRRVEQLAPGLVPTVEINRARTELARRRQQVEASLERWQTASAELNRLLRLDPTTVVEPQEQPHLQVALVDPSCDVDSLIPVGLQNRPELAAHQALVQATLVRLRQERIRPLVPSVILRGTGSATPGLSTGTFGGGLNGYVGDFAARNSMDVQLLWELQNLGLGNRALVRERDAERRGALIELLRMQDRVAAEVAQALARVQRAGNRVKEAEDEVQNAAETAERNLQGLGQTRRVGEQVTLVFRPQEVVAAITALEQAYRGYYAAVGDGNRAQFALYRALGHPAAAVLDMMKASTKPVAEPKATPEPIPVADAPITQTSATATLPASNAGGIEPEPPQQPDLPDGR
jgi:outer membrane protein TolC